MTIHLLATLPQQLASSEIRMRIQSRNRVEFNPVIYCWPMKYLEPRYGMGFASAKPLECSC